MTAEQRSRYATLRHSMISQAKPLSRTEFLPRRPLELSAHAITINRPRTRYTVGRDAVTILPDRRWGGIGSESDLRADELRAYSPCSVPICASTDEDQGRAPLRETQRSKYDLS